MASTNLVTSKFVPQELPGSEHGSFRQRNKVANSFKGPVFTVEEAYSSCALCLAPVNPVERAPVGSSWYHPNCLRCQVCGKGNRTTAYHPCGTSGLPVCNTCHARGMDADPKRVSFLEEHRLLLSNGTRLDPRTTTLRSAQLVEKQANLQLTDCNITVSNAPADAHLRTASPGQPSRQMLGDRPAARPPSGQQPAGPLALSWRGTPKPPPTR